MFFSRRQGGMQRLTRSSGVRLLLGIALFAMLSLQITASDHWHGIADTEHCQVCTQVNQAALAPAVEHPRIPVPRSQGFSAVTVELESSLKTSYLIRGPPKFS